MTIKAHAKVNIFLKIVGLREGYHLISSRFMRVENLYDTLSFIPSKAPGERFGLEGDFGCPIEKNTIYKAYRLLCEAVPGGKVERFFERHVVRVDKKIPEFAGLGGGSSDAAAFLRLCNRVCRLDLPVETLSAIGAKIGADVPFFVHDYPSANVGGIGEVVTPFEEETLEIITHTPPIACDTAAVYREFDRSALDHMAYNADLASEMARTDSDTLLARYDALSLNDLCAPALTLCPDLKQEARDGWYFSGSGSTFFRKGA